MSQRTIPTARELDALTGSRDRVVDLIRLVSLVVVIAGHSLMLTVQIDSDGIELGSLLADARILQALTWVLQILPLFFFAGAAAATYGWDTDRPPSPGHWLLTRAQRLLRPVFWYLAAVLGVLGLLRVFHASALADVVARLGVQLLWFLGAYLLVLAILPLMQRISTGRDVGVVVGGAWLLTAAVDTLRLTTGLDGLGDLTFVTVWMIPAALGVGYAKRLVSVPVAAATALAALLVDVAMVVFGPYEVSLVTVPGQQLSNMSPPTALLAGHAIVLCMLAIALWARLSRLVSRPRIWWWVVLGNRNAMTLYLWHLPVLALVIALGWAAGLPRTGPTDGLGWSVVVTETILLVALMIPTIRLLGATENRLLPLWDAPVARRAGRLRDAGVWVLVTIGGLGLLMLARDGLIGTGLGWGAMAVGAMVCGRLLAASRADAAVAPVPPLPAAKPVERVD
ncbi:acyltransferase family protein [Gordonia soli]|uniref:Acyltransferase 3 domain-containing protein n=1 Tax=Gordonia soli NBRC 108243 TaxID=1223545 RepID=M0QQP4_9ACTN|nr:acyltransferase family protein [Gordonia soli]GAC71000.1 hypothetical protein GS4_46_00140 [Gordonia soli NBRC 108243]